VLIPDFQLFYQLSENEEVPDALQQGIGYLFVIPESIQHSVSQCKRLGAMKEGVLQHHWIMPNGHIRDSVLYSILLEEWPACRERIEQILHTAFGTRR